MLIVTKMKRKEGKIGLVQKQDGVTISVDRNLITVSGPKGEIKRKFMYPPILFKLNDIGLEISAVGKKPLKKDKMFINTYKAHIKNMITGVKEGYVYKLKICSGHFPMTVVVQGKEVLVKNFFGEKVPRKSKILDGAKVSVSGDIITVEGYDKEVVGLTAARIEQSTRIRKRDRRVFQDGCFIIEKAGKNLIGA